MPKTNRDAKIEEIAMLIGMGKEEVEVLFDAQMERMVQETATVHGAEVEYVREIYQAEWNADRVAPGHQI